MTLKFASLLAAGATVLAFNAPAYAHRSYLLPSATQVEIGQGENREGRPGGMTGMGEGRGAGATFITVDGAISEHLFDFDSFPLKLDSLTVTGPDGKPVAIDPPVMGHLRSTFDVPLTQAGTYKIAMVSTQVMGRYTSGGEVKRFRGTEAEAAALPATATDVQLGRMIGRIETFVSAGKPNTTAYATTGKGIELIPVTSPSDLVAGEEAHFKVLIDGQPAANLPVSVIPGGVRYRNALKELAVTTDAQGGLSVKWPMAGMYLVTASFPPRELTATGDPVKPAPGQEPPFVARRLSYAGTFEVLPN